jgi:Tfp pilus assembly protein PilZ
MDSELILPETVPGKGIDRPDLREDRRKHERFWFTFPMELRDSSGTDYRAMILNVSEQGILIETSEEIEVGTEVTGALKLNQDGQEINIRGRVVRMDERKTERGFCFGIELLPLKNSWENVFALLD